MRAILLATFIIVSLLFPGVTAITQQRNQSFTQASCSTTSLSPGSQEATFIVCLSDSAPQTGELANVTMTMTDNCCSLLYYKTMLTISNKGVPVYSASDSCPVQWCTVASGENYSVTFPWTTTGPTGVDTIQGTLYWDFGCRMLGCLVVSPPPAITEVNATIQSSPVGGLVVPTDKLALLAPYLALFLVSMITTTLYLSRFRLRKP